MAAAITSMSGSAPSRSSERVPTMTASGPSSRRMRAKIRAMSLPMNRFVSNVHLDVADRFDLRLWCDFREGEDRHVRQAALQQPPEREPDARRAQG